MRRLSLILLAALAVVPAALAGSSASGDGVLELRAVSGGVVVTGRGALWGQMDKGLLKASDPVPGDGVILVSGADHTFRPALGENVTIYTGKDIHFRVTGGKYKLTFKGTGIDLTAVGVGVAQLTGDPLAVDAGHYALDGGKWVAVPLLQKSVPFGVQP